MNEKLDGGGKAAKCNETYNTPQLEDRANDLPGSGLVTKYYTTLPVERYTGHPA